MALVRTRGAGVLAVAVAVFGMTLIGPSVPDDTPRLVPSLPPGAPGRIVPDRVMSWNICNPCKQGDIDRAREIATHAPQVVGLQEACVRDVERMRDHLRNLYGLEYHVAYGPVLRHRGRCGGMPWRPGGFGQAILSAAPITDRVLVEYPDGGSEDRGYLAVTTRVGGRPLRVFTTHLAQRSQAAVREGQVRVLAAAVAGHRRAVVLGDFNAVPDAAELAPMWAASADADPGCRPPATGACAPTTDWSSKFDYVFLRGVTARGHRVHPTPYSDHDLVTADLAPG
ncbi:MULTISPECIES: endonuclease/exonuclease/phosphatase family protein [unclassified Streptomyces]|uniref:endonuclease/exonuclease/phosphatase family protein n=1 Tax=unclassified Streptomyces TaxID=2593676 RepID=UPI001367B857|nr:MULTISPECIES: endonuclease/exonuclease/phosphatase family protein [unclassified Streptomyces]MCW5252925.1 endonuclease/exonuclease/phosphatase family protein [Streptomyces sp. SHP 1-2]MYU21952.1 endonuclease/exonuclease/phosphatase family protein [Streptomyces sp. SID8352]